MTTKGFLLFTLMMASGSSFSYIHHTPSQQILKYFSEKRNILKTTAKKNRLKNLYRIFVQRPSNIPTVQTDKKNNSGVIPRYTGGRFGDNILAFSHALYFAMQNKCKMLLVPFPYSSQLALDKLLSHSSPDIEHQFKNIVTINGRNSMIDETTDTLFIVPYFPEALIEYVTNFPWPAFFINWDDQAFKQELRKLIAPKNKLNLIIPPTDKVSVAVHIRRGGEFDPKEDVHKGNHIYKCPLDGYYIDQIKKISKFFNGNALYVYLFTDEQNTEELVQQYSRLINEPSITFDCRKSGNNHYSNVLEDFFSMTTFDVLIRPESNFSIMAEKIGNHNIVISPGDFLPGTRINTGIMHIKNNFSECFKNFLADQRCYITGNEFKRCADYVIEDDSCHFHPESIKPKSIIYVKTDYLEYFFTRIFPQIRVPIVLITHNADHPAPGPYAHYLNDSKIIKWFGQNCDIKPHPKFFPIPIGIANPKWGHGNTQVFNSTLDHLNKHPIKKLHGLYINFGDTNPIRAKLKKLFKDVPFSVFAFAKPFKHYLLDMAQYKFVLSPFGNGLDCHRTWEALLVGSVPVVKTSTLDSLYDDLPVIIVQDWSEITNEFLEKKYQEIKARTYNYNKLFMNYWLNLCKADL